MKFIEGIVVTQIGDDKVAVCTGEAANFFKGFINLNETGYIIFDCVNKNMSVEDIASYLCNEYDDLKYDDAIEYINEFLNQFKEKGLLID